MKLRESVVEQLRQADIEVIFGVMGDGNMHLLLDAVERGGMRFVNARHETAAVLMADGYSRRSGRPSVVTVTHGPGLAAAGVGLRVAASAGSPVLVVAGDTARSAYHHVQRLEQASFVHGLEVPQFAVHEAMGAAARVQEAIDAVTAGGGLHVLHLPVDVQEADCDALPPTFAAARNTLRRAVMTPLAGDDDVAELARRLRQARHPLILAGAGARQAAPTLQALAERCGALLGTTVQAHGLFGEHPRAVGIVGGLTLPAVRAQLDEADLVVAFGASLSRFTTDFAQLAPQAEWALVTLERRVQPSVPLTCAVLGDAGDVAERLLAGATPGSGVWQAAAADSAAANVDASSDLSSPGQTDATRGKGDGRLSADMDRQASLHDAAVRGVDPRTLAQALQRLLPADRTEVVGVGHFGGFPLQYSCLGPEGRLLAPWEFGAIGVAVPIALGAALAHPQSWTVAWEGDGSLLASLGELETLARSRARVLVLALDDGAYTAEVRKLSDAGRATTLAEFGRRDLAGAARALGMAAWALDNLADLPAVIATALAGDGPALVHVAIDPAVHQRVF